jgi:hypothetical protein
VLEQLRKEPLQGVMETDPPIQYVKLYDRVGCLSKVDVVEYDWGEFRPIQSLIGERDRHEDVVCDGGNGRD